MPRLSGIKYLFKYVRLGIDRVAIQLQNEAVRHVEMSSSVKSTYVSASEAARRILGFGYMDRQSLVSLLEVHLDGHHSVHYQERNERTATGRERPGTMITDWFE